MEKHETETRTKPVTKPTTNQRRAPISDEAPPVLDINRVFARAGNRLATFAVYDCTMTKRSTIGRALALLLVTFVLTPRAFAQDKVTVSATLSAKSVPAGSNAVIAVILDHQPGWHTWPSIAQDVLPEDIADFAIRTEISIAQKPLP